MAAVARFQSSSVAQTQALGQALGESLEEGDFVGLVGPLGAGKTVFVRGLAMGAGVPEDDVSSPSFTVVNSYAGRLPLYHADFYRIEDARDLYGTGFAHLEDGARVVEWVDRIPSALPPDWLRIVFTDAGEFGRVLDVEPRGSGIKLLERWQQRLRV